ncbi:MAG: siroheme synthase [Deltaproteobacteria bacterium]|nr:MAG: siroheme synthase [Deltaproteobacteria bacterium]PIE74992.1 MAG: siroheme synthase [Deltaproteobacteria bacterium]
MEFYPVYLKFKGRNVIVVGGGEVAFRKVKRLLDYGAFVMAVAPVFTKEFSFFKQNKNFSMKIKEFDKKDIFDAFFVFAATDNMKVNIDVSEVSRKKGVLCNIADSSDRSDFILPSYVKRGSLVFTVSTGGKSPALARKIRQDLEKQYGDDYEIFIYLLGKIRTFVLKSESSSSENREKFRAFVFGNLLDYVKSKNLEGIKEEIGYILKDSVLAEKIMEILVKEKNDYFFGDGEKI